MNATEQHTHTRAKMKYSFGIAGIMLVALLVPSVAKSQPLGFVRLSNAESIAPLFGGHQHSNTLMSCPGNQADHSGCCDAIWVGCRDAATCYATTFGTQRVRMGASASNFTFGSNLNPDTMELLFPPHNKWVDFAF